MEVRIGIKHSPRELSFETDTAAAEVRSLIEAALTTEAPVVALTDNKGREYLVVTDTITYIEIGAETGRKVGFIS